MPEPTGANLPASSTLARPFRELRATVDDVERRIANGESIDEGQFETLRQNFETFMSEGTGQAAGW